MRARWVVAAALGSGCWTSTPLPPGPVLRPTASHACSVFGDGARADVHVSAVAGDVPFLVGFWVERATVQIARVAGNGWLPLELRLEELAVYGFMRASELELYLRAARKVGDVFVVGSSQRLELIRADGDGAEVAIGLPAAVRLVDPASARPRIKCSDLSAFVAAGDDARETLGIRDDGERRAFATASVAIAAVPGGPEVATLDTHDRIAETLDEHGAFTRVWVRIREADDLSAVGWVPTSALAAPPAEQGTSTGWGTIGSAGKEPPMRRCGTKVVVSLVRAGQRGRVPVGEIAAGGRVEIDATADVPPGTVALGHHTIGSLRLVDGARLVIDEAACGTQDEVR